MGWERGACSLSAWYYVRNERHYYLDILEDKSMLLGGLDRLEVYSSVRLMILLINVKSKRSGCC